MSNEITDFTKLRKKCFDIISENEILYKTLLQTNSLINYLSNFMMQNIFINNNIKHTKEDILKALKIFFEGNPKELYISNAFVFKNSLQNHSYWLDINLIYVKKLNGIG